MNCRSGTSGQITWQVRDSSEGACDDTSHPIQFLFARGHVLNKGISAPAAVSAPELSASYLERGPREFSRLVEGTLSFALWDGEARRLILSTDRLGLHPIYYYFYRNNLLVSWKVEDLVPHVPDSRVDMMSLSAQVAGFLLPEGRTFYEGIRRVPAGMIVTVDEDGFRLKRYWSLDEVTALRLPDDDAYREALRERLSAVHSDWLRVLPAPAGIALSGGMDSTSVAAVVRELDFRQRIRAFSWLHPGLPEADESEEIREVCRVLDLDLTPIRADQQWTLSDPQGLRTPREGPEAHYYRESWEAIFQEAASRGHSYLFSGVGGDELFGSISAYPDLFLSGRWISLAAQLGRERKDPGFNLRYIFRSTLDPLLRNRFPAWERKRTRLPAGLTKNTRERVRGLLPPPLRARRGDLGRRLRIRWLQNLARNTLLLRISRIAGRFEMVMIHPLLDRRIVEFAASLSATHNSCAGKDKLVLRRAFEGILPAPVLQRKRKITVESLFHRGFRERETEKIWPLLRDMRAAELGLVDQASLQDQYRLYLKGEGHGLGIWNAVSVEDWLRRYF